MGVRAKFKLNSFTTELHSKWVDGKNVGDVEIAYSKLHACLRNGKRGEQSLLGRYSNG